MRLRAPTVAALCALSLATAITPGGDASAQRRRGRGRTSRPAETTGDDGATSTSTTDASSASSSSTTGAPSTADAPRDSSTSTQDSSSSSSDAASRSDAPAERDEAPAPARPAVVDLSLGMRAFGRYLSYNDDIFQALRPYELYIAPAFTAQAEFFPFAATMRNVLAHVGLTASFEQAFAISSARRTGTTEFPTSSHAASAGLRVRIPIARSELGVNVAYGVHAFSLGNAEAARAGEAEIPGITDVRYEFLRLGLGARIALGERVAILASAAYDVVFGAGELTRAPYFPRARVGGIEAQLGLSVATGGGIELRLTGEMRRYFFDLNPEPGDMYVAGGALDQYFSGTLWLAYRR